MLQRTSPHYGWQRHLSLPTVLSCYPPSLPPSSPVHELLGLLLSHAQLGCQLACSCPIHNAEVDLLAKLALLSGERVLQARNTTSSASSC